MVELLEKELALAQQKKPSAVFTSNEYLTLLHARVEVSSNIHGREVRENSVRNYEDELDALAEEKEMQLELRARTMKKRRTSVE